MRAWPGPVLLALVAVAAPIEAREWRLDAGASRAGFDVPVLRFFTSHGRFQDLSGTLTWDPGTRELRVHARIPTATLEMGNERQTRWARSKDFLDVARYPEIVFESEPTVLDALHDGMTIEGRLTLRGKTNPVVLELGPTNCDLQAGGPCELSAGTRVQRAAFDLPRYRALVGDEVTLTLSVVARQQPEP